VPELPDLTVYLEALQQRIIGARLESITLHNPFLLRTAVPPLASAYGREVRELRRIGSIAAARRVAAHRWHGFNLTAES